MAYEVLTGIKIKTKTYEVGDIINKSQIPKTSIEWLLEQKIVIDTKDKEYQEKKLQETANVKAEEEWKKDMEELAQAVQEEEETDVVAEEVKNNGICSRQRHKNIFKWNWLFNLL